MATAAVITANDVLTLAEPLLLDGGQRLDGVNIAYETYGELTPAKDNAVLVCHATTGEERTPTEGSR